MMESTMWGPSADAPLNLESPRPGKHALCEQMMEAASATGSVLGRAASCFNRTNLERMRYNSEAYLRSHPGALLGISAGLGFLIGLVTRRK